MSKIPVLLICHGSGRPHQLFPRNIDYLLNVHKT